MLYLLWDNLESMVCEAIPLKSIRTTWAGQSFGDYKDERILGVVQSAPSQPPSHLCVSILVGSLEKVQADVIFKLVGIKGETDLSQISFTSEKEKLILYMCACDLCVSKDNFRKLIFFFGHIGSWGSNYLSDWVASVLTQWTTSLGLTLDFHSIKMYLCDIGGMVWTVLSYIQQMWICGQQQGWVRGLLHSPGPPFQPYLVALQIGHSIAGIDIIFFPPSSSLSNLLNSICFCLLCSSVP